MGDRSFNLRGVQFPSGMMPKISWSYANSSAVLFQIWVKAFSAVGTKFSGSQRAASPRPNARKIDRPVIAVTNEDGAIRGDDAAVVRVWTCLAGGLPAVQKENPH